MTISRALSNATSGLSATALRASIASNNVANANNPGYARRDLSVAERAYGGVIASGVNRAQDLVLTADRRIAEASFTRADVTANSRIQFSQALGDPETGYGLFSVFQNFESTLTDLSVTPESAALQNALLLAGNDLTAEFNNLNDMIIQERVAADEAIAAGVETVNKALADIRDINKSLMSADPVSETAASLQDQREQLIDDVSRLIPVKVIRSDNDQVHLMTREGVYLLSEKVQEVEFTRTPAITAGDSYPTTGLSGLSVNGVDITPGGSSQMAIQSGAMAGYFDIRDRIAPEFQAQVDALAADLVSRFESAGLDPTLAAGDAGLFTDDGTALNPADTAGLAGRLSINGAVDPALGGQLWRLRDGINAAAEGPTGNGTIFNNMIDALTTKNSSLGSAGLPGNFSMAEAIAEVNGAVGEARTRAEATTASAMARADILAQAELKVSAVDTDQEMQALLMIEQAYAANARVIQAVNDMMRSLMEI